MNEDHLLEAAEQVRREQRVDRWTALMLVFLKVLERIELPKSLAASCDLATRYWRDGEVTRVELQNERHETWVFLDELIHRGQSESDSAILARATLSVLTPLRDDDAWFDTVEWFAKWTSGRR